MNRIALGHKPRHKVYVAIFGALVVIVAASVCLSYNSLRKSNTVDTKYWSTFKPLNLPRFDLADAAPDCLPRKIFIDAGARMGDTLDLFEQSRGSSREGPPWEVFAFEIVPMNAHFAQ
jgi:hypothetical protein